MSPPLLILDLDETLVYSTENEPNPRADFSFLHFAVQKRPFLDLFIAAVAQWYELAVWTSSSAGYAHPVIDHVFPDRSLLKFIWCHDRCTRRFDAETYDYYSLKNLRKVERAGYPLERVLMIDDSPEKLNRNYGNHIRIKPFLGDPADTELHELLPFLSWIREQTNFRTIEKRGWRDFVPPVAD